MIKSSHILTFSFGAGVTVLLMLGLGYQLDGAMGLCKLEAAGSSAETPATCLRSWLGALSGWVAAAGALGVGLPTLHFLQNQIKLPIAERQLEHNQEACRALNEVWAWLRKEDQEKFPEIMCISHAYNYSAAIVTHIQAITSDLPSDMRAKIMNKLSPFRVFEKAIKQLVQQPGQTDFTPDEARKAVHQTLFSLTNITWHLHEEITEESEKLAKWKRDLLLN